MNGYKRILYQSLRELERCKDMMELAKKANDSAEFTRWTNHSMHVEDIINYLEIKIEATK